MQPSSFTMAHQLVLDVLATRPPAPGQTIRMCAVEPQHLPAERLRLARQLGHLVPQGAQPSDAAKLAGRLAPYLSRRINASDGASLDDV